MPGEHLILFDGVCGLCNRFVRFVLARDRRERFVFAPLQGESARRLLARHGLPDAPVETMFVVAGRDTPREKLLRKSTAAFFVLRELGGFWRAAALLRVVPRFLRDAGYDFVARHRYRVFGKSDSCPMPAPEHRRRFL